MIIILILKNIDNNKNINNKKIDDNTIGKNNDKNIDKNSKNNDKINNVNTIDEKFENEIKVKVKYYHKILNDINKEIHENKEGLILYYSRLNQYNFIIQVSIILLSSISTFIQSYLPEEERNDYIKVALLSITSYSGFILSLSKFFKLEEKKENSNNLKDRYADLEMKITFYIDYINAWNNSAYYSNIYESNKKKYSEWCNVVEKFESEYINIIEYKKELNSNYERIIDTNVNRIYIKRYLKNQKNKERKDVLKNALEQQKHDTKISFKLQNQSKKIYIENTFKKISFCDKLKYLFCNIMPEPIFNKYSEYHNKMLHKKNGKDENEENNDTNP